MRVVVNDTEKSRLHFTRKLSVYERLLLFLLVPANAFFYTRAVSGNGLR